MASSFYVTISNTAFKAEFPSNTSTNYKFKTSLDLRDGYEVAIVNQVLSNPYRNVLTAYHVTSNIVHPRVCNRTFLPIIRTGKLSSSIDVHQYIPCVPGQFDLIDIKLVKIAGSDIEQNAVYQITLHFRKLEKPGFYQKQFPLITLQ